MRFILTTFLLLSIPAVLWAQQFTWNEEIRDAYSLLLDLRFKQADSTLKILAVREPKNLCVPYLQDLSDFLFIVVSEDRKEFDRRELFREKRLKALESAAVSDPFRNVALGEHQLHWAFSNMRFGNYLNGAMGIRKAFQLLEDNTHRFPNLLHTYKSMGLLHTLVGTVPDNYQWATKLMGVNGSITQGMSEMQRVIKGTSGRPEFGLVQKETLFLFTFLQINLVNDDAALKNIDRYLAKQSGPLMDFAKARILQKNGRTDEAIALLETSLTSRPYVFPYLQFLLGEMKLSRMDADANKALDIYLRIFKGNSYKKAAYHKLAWHALLVQHDQKSYFSYLTRISNVGSTMVDEDRAAQQESEVRKLPNVHLLRARIMFDGGYYTKAIESLENAPQSSFISQDEKLELSYRMGRLRHEIGDHKKAIEHYETTCKNGATSTRYFAANASLQLGLLYEKLGEKEKARKYFQACSTFKNTEYRDSINQKAKAGLLRL